MLGTYTYNEIFRKSVIAFGTLFNNIEIRRKVDATNYEYMKVPFGVRSKAKNSWHAFAKLVIFHRKMLHRSLYLESRLRSHRFNTTRREKYPLHNLYVLL